MAAELPEKEFVFTPPSILGTPVVPGPDTYQRNWTPSVVEEAAAREVEHERRLAFPRPVLRSEMASLSTSSTRPTKRYPLGRVTSVEAGWLTGERPQPPPGIRSVLLKVIDVDGLGIYLEHSRGFDMDAHGDPKAAPVWEHRTPDLDDSRSRIQVGSLPPEPVDCWRLRLVWHAGVDTFTRQMIGTWVGSAPDTFQVWEPDVALVTLPDLTTWTIVLDTVLGGGTVADGRQAAADQKAAAALRRAQKKAGGS